MKQRMQRGELYIADDPDLAADFARGQALVERYNALPHARQDARDRVLRELLGAVGDGVVVRPEFRCEYGTPISIGAGTFIKPAARSNGPRSARGASRWFRTTTLRRGFERVSHPSPRSWRRWGSSPPASWRG